MARLHDVVAVVVEPKGYLVLGVGPQVVGGDARFHEVGTGRFAEFRQGNWTLVLVIVRFACSEGHG